jgi:Cof subfamily protein (haloacid dehalogenase superfamily)
MERFYHFNRKADRKLRMEIRIIGDSKEFVRNTSSEINKIVVIDKDLDYLNSIRKRIDHIPGVETTKSDIDNIEIGSKGSSKGNGLSFLAKYYGVSLEECIAIGNDENDISMIRCAGLGIAVKNARDHIKEFADYVTEKDNNNGAIGEAIEKFMLNKLVYDR